MCGQNVGRGAGPAARLGLIMLSFVSSVMSQAILLTMMRSTFLKNRNMDASLVLTESLRTGFYFRQNEEQIAILKVSDPVAGLAKYGRPVLFVNGSADHRDSEGKWLAVSNKASGDKSELVVYEGGVST